MEKIQSSFSGGVIDPELWHRTDLAVVQNGLKTCENAVITNNGNWMMRPGTVYCNYTIDSANQKSRLIPFYVSDSERYIIELSDGLIRFLDGNGVPVPVSLSNYPVWQYNSTYTENDIVRYPNYISIVGGLLGLQELYLWLPYGGGMAVDDVLFSINTTDNLLVDIFDSTLVIALAKTTPSKNTLALIQAGLDAIGVENGWRILDCQIGGNAAYIAEPITTVFSLTGNVWHGTEGCYLIDTDLMNPRISAEFEAGDDMVLVSPYSESEIFDVRFVQNGNDMYLAHGSHKPMTISYFNLVSAAFRLREFEFLNYPMITVGQFNDLVLSDFSQFYIDSTYMRTLHVLDSYGDKLVGNSLVGSKIKTLTPFKEQSIALNFTSETEYTSDPFYSSGIIHWTIANFPAGLSVIELQVTTDSYLWGGPDTATWTTAGYIGTNETDFFDYGKPCLFRLYFSTTPAVSFDIALTIPAHVSYGLFTIGENNNDGTFDLTEDVPTTIDGKYTWNGFIDHSLYYIQHIGDYFGWPKLIYYFQNRLGFANTSTFPTYRFESKTGIYNDFSVSNPILADDAMIVTIGNGETEIKNIVIHDNMVIMTGTNENKVIPDSTGYGPLNIPITRKVSENGSSAVEPLILNKSLIYLGYGADRIREADNYYSNETAIEIDDDLTRFTHHLFDGYTITRLTYSRTPFPIVWALRSDGKLLSCTFDRMASIAAWSIHNFGAGTPVEDIMVLRGTNDTLFLIINRSGVRHIESLTFAAFDEIADAVRVDSAVIMTADPASTTFESDDYPNLVHLNTQVVKVLADGWPTQKTVQSSVLTLSAAAEKVIAGLPYTAILEPLHPIIDRKTGTGHAIIQQVPQTKVRFINSVGGYLGEDSGSVREIKRRNSDPTVPDPIFTGWQKFDMLSTYTTEFNYDESQFYFKQVSPLPAQISAIITTIE